MVNNHVHVQGVPYMVQIVPKIKTLSHATGSLAGGLQLTIQMEGLLLSSDKVTVDIDGADCKITAKSRHVLSFNNLYCIVEGTN